MHTLTVVLHHVKHLLPFSKMYHSIVYGILSTLWCITKAQQFEMAGRSGVPVMHAALLTNGKVVFLDKLEDYTESRLSNGRYAYSTEYDPKTQTVQPLSLVTNAFCCGGSFLADGTLMTMGGNGPLTWLDDSITDSFAALRYLFPNENSQGWIEYPGTTLSSNRWYATVQTLSDGTIFVASGSLNGMNIYDHANNNPTYEMLDQWGKPSTGSINMNILVDNQPYWMYPFLHLLKDGSLFIFTDKASQLFDVHNNRPMRELPALPGLHRTYPNTGSSVMLPLRAKNNYEPEIMICGGGERDAEDAATDSTCGRISPMSDKASWTMTEMPGGGRIMVEGVLLLDGTILWINGARRGCQGFGTASEPALDALIYNPQENLWHMAGHTEIPRLYHSVALMLLDGSILVAGSNPNEMPILEKDIGPGDSKRQFPTEFRVERWTPSYVSGDNAKRRPTYVEISENTLIIGKTVAKISFKSLRKPQDVIVWLYHGGFVTHALHMGQVMIELEHLNFERIKMSERYEMSVMIANIKIAPGPYVLYVVVDGVPSTGQFVSVQLG